MHCGPYNPVAPGLIIPTVIATRNAIQDMIDTGQAYLNCADQHPDAAGRAEIERLRELVQYALQKDQELAQWVAEHGRLPLPF